MNPFTNRESKFWKLYEACSPYIALVSFVIVAGEIMADVILIFEPSFPNIIEPTQKWITILSPYFISILFGIIILDGVKFKLTNDPRDEPGRKWWSARNSGKHLSSEIVILPNDISALRNAALNIQLCSFVNIKCPKCGVTHAFKIDEIEARICCFYGCREIIPNPKGS
jgi:hypothetical protein